MRVVDANVLIYSVNEDALHHADSKRWIEHALNGGDTVAFTWNALLAFCRITTHHALLLAPLTSGEATEQLELWLSSPNAKLLDPGPKHLRILSDLLDATGTGGNLINDAHLAAVALEHRADLVSYDNDFTRFPGVRWRTPTQLLGE